MTLLEEDRKRQAAIRIQMEMEKQYGIKVTRPGPKTAGDVIPSAETVKTAAGGRAGRGGSPGKGQKIASLSAAARAPEAAARPARKTNEGSTGAFAPEAAAARTRPNKRENEFMMNLMVLRNSLAANAPACRERAKKAGKWTWRDIRLMYRLVCKIQDALLRTMPESRDEYYTAYALHGHYELHIDGPVRVPKYLLVKDRHLADLADAAMRNECVMCMREGSEIGQCPLRAALLEYAPPTELQEGRWKKCEYRDAAGQLILGKDVTI